jgi:hypothetical protein
LNKNDVSLTRRLPVGVHHPGVNKNDVFPIRRLAVALPSPGVRKNDEWREWMDCHQKLSHESAHW